MSAFSGIKDAKRGFQSKPCKDGQYVLRIDGNDFFDTNQAGEMWKITGTILSVIDGDHKVGEVVHIFFRVNAGKQTFQQNLKAYLAGVLDVDDELIDEPATQKALGDDSPMNGLVTIVTGRRRTSKKKLDEKTGQPVEYTVYAWTPSLSSDEIEAAIGEDGVKRFFPNGL
jgi:hypothetical protein